MHKNPINLNWKVFQLNSYLSGTKLMLFKSLLLQNEVLYLTCMLCLYSVSSTKLELRYTQVAFILKAFEVPYS